MNEVKPVFKDSADAAAHTTLWGTLSGDQGLSLRLPNAFSRSAEDGGEGAARRRRL